MIPTAPRVWVGTPTLDPLTLDRGLRWPVRAPQPCAMGLVLPWKQERIRGLAETMHSGLVRKVWGSSSPQAVFPATWRRLCTEGNQSSEGSQDKTE